MCASSFLLEQEDVTIVRGHQMPASLALSTDSHHWLSKEHTVRQTWTGWGCILVSLLLKRLPSWAEQLCGLCLSSSLPLLVTI